MGKVRLCHCCLPGSKDDNLLQVTRWPSFNSNVVLKRDKIISKIDGGSEIELDNKDYVVKNRVGSGNFSNVFLLERKDDRRRFVGKFYKDGVCTKEFVREINIMNSCSNSCSTIVRLVGIFTTPKCLVMDYYVNGSLSDALIEDRKNVDRGIPTEYPFLRRLSYILDMCKAVNELHQRNICHRDIAMRNLLLSDDKEHVSLSDFSLSRVVESPFQTQSTLTAIVPAESAPETFSRSSTDTGRKSFGIPYSLKSDIWSIGITMYEIIDHVFCKGQNWEYLPTSFLNKNKPSKWVFNRIDELWYVILRCWQEKSEKRPQSWDLEDRIQNLIENPINVESDHSGYITRFLIENTRSGTSSCKYSMQSNSELEPVLTSSKMLEYDYMNCSKSLQIGITPSTSTEYSSPHILKRITSGPQIKILAPGRKTLWKRKQKQGTWKGTIYENSCNEYKATIYPRPSLTENTSSITLIKNSSYTKPAKLKKNMTDPLDTNSHLRVKRRWKFVKRLGSFSSMNSTTVTSSDEVPCSPERVDYCPSLDFSSRTSVTNVAYCQGRRFFSKSPGKVISKEKIDSTKYLLKPPVDQSLSVIELNNIETPTLT